MGVLCQQLIRAHVDGGAGDDEATKSELLASPIFDPFIRPALVLIHSEPDKPWTVANLARHVQMSRSAFSDRFRDVVGVPPLQYLTQFRMRRACELLCNSKLGVKQIAAMVGYESPSSFTSAFKRITGASPASYRTANS